MSRITALKSADRFRRRVRVFLDGKSAFNLEAEVATRAGLRVGQELDSAQIEALTGQDRHHRSLNQALRYLDYRPRSETELREKLIQKGIASSEIETVVKRLKKERLLDDDGFAQFWKENRQSFSPRSKKLVRLELKRKGITDEVIDRVTGELNDEDGAYRAALGKARHLELAGYQIFRRRLGSYLKRRGFDYEVINGTLARIWQEQGHNEP